MTAIGQFAAGVFVARSLGPADFGIWSYAVAYTSIVASVVDFGMSFLVVRDLARRPTETARYLGNLIAVKVVLSLAALGTIAATLPLIGGTRDHWPVIMLLGGQTVFASITMFAAATMYARDRLLPAAAIRGAQGLALATSIAAVAAAGGGLLPFALAYAAVGAIALAAAVSVLASQFGPVRAQLDPSFLRPYLRQLLPLAVAVTLTTVYYSADAVMLGLAGRDRDLGWYNAGYRMIYALLLLLAALNQTFLPDQARALDAGGLRRTGTLRSYYHAIWAFGLPIAALGPLAAPSALRLVYGAEYGGGALALQILLGAGSLMFFSSFFSSLVLLTHRHVDYLRGIAIGAVANVALNFALIPEFSLHGAAAATVVAEGLVALYMRLQCRRLLPEGTRGIPLTIPILVAGTAGAALALAAVGIPLLLAVLVAGAVYLGVLYATGLLKQPADGPTSDGRTSAKPIERAA